MFGPINLSKKSIDYGKIIQSPKEHWRNVNIIK